MSSLILVVGSGRQWPVARPNCISIKGKFEDNEGVIRILKWKDRQYHDQNKSTMIYKALHRKHEHTKKLVVAIIR